MTPLCVSAMHQYSCKHDPRSAVLVMIQSMQNITATRSLDVKGLNCPMPVLRTKIVLGEMASGEILAVLSTDPHSVPDFRAFCAHTGNELLQVTESGKIFEFLIRRA